MMGDKVILVTGAGGFIGSHLVKYLHKQREGFIVGADLHEPEFEPTFADEFHCCDLRDWHHCNRVVKGVDEVYALAADMGGMGFITTHQSDILYNNALINFQTLEAAKRAGVSRYLYTSSACVYPEYKQMETDVTPLKEEDAYPAQPDQSYGWEKLITEQLCQHYRADHGIETRIVRFHNIFGTLGTWRGGREKAPAALCRKVAVAKLTGAPSIDIWGDGEQTRSFCYIDDCVKGIHMIMQSEWHDPINLGQDRMISINELAHLIMDAAGYHCDLVHIPGPLGVRGRNSDNTRIYNEIGWRPEVSLEEGLKRVYDWIEELVNFELADGVLPIDLSRSVTYGNS